MEDLDYGRFERAICDGVQFAAADPERLKRERNYQLLQAASRIAAANTQVWTAPDEDSYTSVQDFDAETASHYVDQALALLAEIEGRSK